MLQTDVVGSFNDKDYKTQGITFNIHFGQIFLWYNDKNTCIFSFNKNCTFASWDKVFPLEHIGMSRKKLI